MKIYIDWEEKEVYTDKDRLILDLLQQEILTSFWEWLEDKFNIEEVFNFSEEKKKTAREEYEKDVEEEFDRKYSINFFDTISIIEVSAEKEITVKMI